LNHPDLVFVTTRYYYSSKHKYLSNLLVDELRSQGRNVHVIAIGNVDHKGTEVLENGSDTYIPFKIKVKYIKFIILWLKGTIAAVATIRKTGSRFDLLTIAPVIATSPLVYILNKYSRTSVGMVFDIFPEHQRQLGHISKIIAKLCGSIEKQLLKSLDHLTAMSQANKDAMEKYYQISSEKINILHLWIEKSPQSQKLNLKSDSKSPCKIELIFGGQIAPGRDLSKAIKFLMLLRNDGLNINLNVFSSIQDMDVLKSEYNQEAWITWNEAVSRSQFRENVFNADFGLAVTDERVSLPTIPSKALEYISCGTPVYCIVEYSSDIGTIVSNDSLILVNNFNFDEHALLQAKKFFSNPRSSTHQEAIDNFTNKFSTKIASQKLLSLLDS